MLSSIRGIFWDVGGVLLSNAWDHEQRAVALEKFGIDPKEFHSRHEMVVSSFERGKIGLDSYLDKTIFYESRSFTREAFKEMMFSLSTPTPGALDIARALADSGKYFMGTINNESRELNLYRIEKWGMRKIFRLFISSCFVGLRKPEPGIYQLAIETTQIPPEQCCFIDDRALNLESAAALGMKTIEMKDAAQLKRDLEAMGVGA
jgi:putative hydrolase of the HAD superfamily